jgi:hypothetical protein
MTMIAERILAAMCKPPGEVPYDDPTDPAQAIREIPSEPLLKLHRGKLFQIQRQGRTYWTSDADGAIRRTRWRRSMERA